MNQSRVAIIYLSYNARPYIDDVVLSLANQTYPKELMKLVIVENPSGDDSEEYIKDKVLPRSEQDLPKIKLFPNDKNTGYAIGNNIGINHALLEGFDYVYLLNNDAKLDSRAIEKAVEMAESNPKIGSVQSLMRLWQEPDKLNSSGNMIHFLGFGFSREYGVNFGKSKARDGEEIAYASGAAVLYRAEVLKKIGALDEFLWLYHEDLELGWRIMLAGYTNVLSLYSVAYHKYEFSRSIKKWFWMERNRWIVMLTHYHILSIILLLPTLLLVELGLVFLSIPSGWFKHKMLTYYDLLKPATIKNILAKRRISQQSRVVSDREVMQRFTGRIGYQNLESISESPLSWFANLTLDFIWQVIRKIIWW